VWAKQWGVALLTPFFLQWSSSDQLSSSKALPSGQLGLATTAAPEETMITLLTFASWQAFNTFSVPVTAGAMISAYNKAATVPFSVNTKY
jgi:hypothetical protein